MHSYSNTLHPERGWSRIAVYYPRADCCSAQGPSAATERRLPQCPVGRCGVCTGRREPPMSAYQATHRSKHFLKGQAREDSSKQTAMVKEDGLVNCCHPTAAPRF